MFGLRPEDEFTIYENPVSSVITLVTQTTLVQPDPYRVLLSLSTDASANALFLPFLWGGPSIVGGGYNLVTANPLLILTLADHGVFCQAGYTVGSTNLNLNAYAVSVRIQRPPEMAGFDIFKARRLNPAERPVVPGVVSRGRLGARSRLPAGILRTLHRLYPHLYPYGE